MTKLTLRDLLKAQRPVLLDGAMGTQLAARGLEMGGQNCLTHPECVREIHRLYVAAGAEAVTTNTLTMNRIFLEAHGMAVDVEAVNAAGVRLAREGADGRPVLGNLSSTGALLEPYGEMSVAACEQCLREQAQVLANNGVDGFIAETFTDLAEALCAVRACRAVSDKPVLATLAFQTAEMTFMGNKAADAALALVEAGADAVGANCASLPPGEMAKIAAAMARVVDVPIIIQPNAGMPQTQNGKLVFDMTPDAFVSGMRDCLAAGARIVGGCCGTTPAHIRALGEALQRARATDPVGAV